MEIDLIQLLNHFSSKYIWSTICLSNPYYDLQILWFCQLLIYYSFFQLQLLRYLGVQPVIDTCPICTQTLYQTIYNKSIGQLICHKCNHDTTNTLALKKQELIILKYLSNTHIDNLADNMIIDLKLFNTIKQYLLYYISFHIVNIQNIKSIKFIA